MTVFLKRVLYTLVSQRTQYNLVCELMLHANSLLQNLSGLFFIQGQPVVVIIVSRNQPYLVRSRTEVLDTANFIYFLTLHVLITVVYIQLNLNIGLSQRMGNL